MVVLLTEAAQTVARLLAALAAAVLFTTGSAVQASPDKVSLVVIHLLTDHTAVAVAVLAQKAAMQQQWEVVSGAQVFSRPSTVQPHSVLAAALGLTTRQTVVGLLALAAAVLAETHSTQRLVSRHQTALQAQAVAVAHQATAALAS